MTGSRPTTRVVLTLDYAGLGGNTRVLDGGMAAWKAAGRPITADPSAAAARIRLSDGPGRPVVVTLDDVRSEALSLSHRSPFAGRQTGR